MIDETNSLDRRYRTYAWGTFFILLGALILMPGNQFRIFLLGIGITLLMLNLARYRNKIRVNTVTTTFGLIAILLVGAATLLNRLEIHFELPLFPTLLVGIGVIMLLNVILEKREDNDTA